MLVDSRREGAVVWPRGEQQIGIGVGLRNVPSKCTVVKKWKAVGNVAVRFLRVFLFGLVVELVGYSRRINFVWVIGLIVHTVCDLLSRNG